MHIKLNNNTYNKNAQNENTQNENKEKGTEQFQIQSMEALCENMHWCLCACVCKHACGAESETPHQHRTKVTVCCLTQLVTCSDFLCSTLGWTEGRGAARSTGLRIS